MQELLLPIKILENLNIVWTFLLLVVRFTGLLFFLPGIGASDRGLMIRMPAIMILAYTAVLPGPYADLPGDWVLFAAGLFSEMLFGLILGLIPALVIYAGQLGAQLSATTMGLGAGQLMDPTTGMQVPSLSLLIGDLMICVFLILGGHYSIIYTAAGLNASIIPGTFLVSEASIQMLVNRCGEIFRMGVMISAPVLVALLVTQFVLGLISRAVPQVNIFIVSFPLTIGIGLVLTWLSLPEIINYSRKEFRRVETAAVILADGAERIEQAQGAP